MILWCHVFLKIKDPDILINFNLISVNILVVILQ